MAPKIVYANTTTSFGRPTGGTIRIKAGEAWFADEPIVKHRPEFFDDTPPLSAVKGRAPVVVEQATAAPGEKRVRASKKS